MWIKSLAVKNCRLIRDIKIDLSADINILYGNNASGKTSLLEAIYILSTGKSFRTHQIIDVISHNKSGILVSGEIKNSSESSNYLGIEKSNKVTKIRINRKNIFSQAALSQHLPVTVIHPSSTHLITGGPSLRRSFIDWMAFYLFPDFQKKWKEYKHVLRQRNICLKYSKHRFSLQKWTEELVLYQPELIEFREKVLNIFRPLMITISKELLINVDLDISLKSGFPIGTNLDIDSLLCFYRSKENYDLKVQRTTAGVHVADFSLTVNKIPVAKEASKGQLKLYTTALLLAQSIAIQGSENRKSVILIDDLSSELDSENEENLLRHLLGLNQQIILTSISKDISSSIESRMFHVKHGEYYQV